MRHFGVTVNGGKYGLKLTRENYAIPNSRNSIGVYTTNEEHREYFGFDKYQDETGKYYSDEWCEKHREKCLVNFDLNMAFFAGLDHNVLETELQNLLIKVPKFQEVFDLNQYANMPGYYIMVLDEYKQVYVGTTKDIKKRIQRHWAQNLYFDRLIFGDVMHSKLSINSFRPLDTTRIFAYSTRRTYITESTYIKYFSSEFICNRLAGGLRPEGVMKMEDFETMNRELTTNRI